MNFDLNLEAFTSEADVRENICAPLIRELGYLIGTQNHVITEQSLRYPRQSLGRKKSSDPLLRGKADYTLVIQQRYRWILEAKAASETISEDDREQAYTYATHPEVKGLYYVLTNGRTFEIHSTLTGPDAPAVFTTTYECLETDLQKISNLLRPDAIQREFPNITLDVGKPLAPGFRSVAKILNGNVSYTKVTPAMTGIVGLTNFIREGSIERSDGKLLAYLKVSSGYKQIDDFNRALGLEIFEIYSNAPEVSSDPNSPTLFEASLNWHCPPGSRVQVPPLNHTIDFSGMSVVSQTKAMGFLDGNKFKGKVSISLKMSKLFTAPIQIEGDIEITVG
jgi:hypothetical protein